MWLFNPFHLKTDIFTILDLNNSLSRFCVYFRKKQWDCVEFGQNLRIWGSICWPSITERLLYVLIFSNVCPRAPDWEALLRVRSQSYLFTRQVNYSGVRSRFRGCAPCLVPALDWWPLFMFTCTAWNEKKKKNLLFTDYQHMYSDRWICWIRDYVSSHIVTCVEYNSYMVASEASVVSECG